MPSGAKARRSSAIATRSRPTRATRSRRVLFTHNETATGVTSDVAGVRKALNETGHPALLMVDGVSSIASIDFRMDEWGVDLAVTGSQKGLMLPAGLGIVCASQKALAQYDQAKLPRCFFDFGDMRKANATGYFPYTPSLPHALRPARVHRDAAGGGAGERLRPPPPARGGHPPGGEGVGARALRQGAEVELRHGQRHHGSGRRERRRGDRRRLPPLQPGAGRRPRADGRPALPHRAPGRPQRADAGRARSPARRWRCATWG